MRYLLFSSRLFSLRRFQVKTSDRSREISTKPMFVSPIAAYLRKPQLTFIQSWNVYATDCK